MKISRQSKAKAARRRHATVRLINESFEDYRWWTHQDVEPECGYVLVEYVRTELAHPKELPASKRLPKHARLSRRALKRRLYYAKVPKSQWPQLLATYANTNLMRLPGSPDIRKEWGHAVEKAVARHVKITFVVLDEFWYLSKLTTANIDFGRSCRKVNSGVVTVAQGDGPEGHLPDRKQITTLPESAGV